MKLVSLCFAAVLVSATPALAQDEPKSVPKSTSGSTGSSGSATGVKQPIGGQVYVDERTPPFDLPSSRGRQVSPARFRGDWVLLYFSEGRRGFADLKRAYAEITGTGCTVLGLSKSNPQTLRTWAERLAATGFGPGTIGTGFDGPRLDLPLQREHDAGSASIVGIVGKRSWWIGDTLRARNERTAD